MTVLKEGEYRIRLTTFESYLVKFMLTSLLLSAEATPFTSTYRHKIQAVPPLSSPLQGRILLAAVLPSQRLNNPLALR
jgi:hypothetical protein